MEENRTPDAPEIRVGKNRFLLWLDNVWYHYKWGILITLFFVIMLTVCISQCAVKENYDVYYMYAGDYEVGMTSDNGGIPENVTIAQVLGGITPDRNKDGKASPSFLPLFYLTDRQIADKNAALKEEGSSEEVNITLIRQNNDTLRSNLLLSDYYICFLSPAAYEEAKGLLGEGGFADLAAYTGDTTTAAFYDAGAVKLSSLPIGSQPGLSNLPEDTLVCLRTLSEVATHTDKKRNTEVFAAAEEALRALFAFGE